MTDTYTDEPCIVSFWIGELGWLIQRWQARLRYLKHKEYQEHKFIIFMNLQFHALINDFVSMTMELPTWWNDLGLETDCYEAPISNSPPGSLTPSDVYSKLIKYMRDFYNVDKAVEIFPPRGCGTVINNLPQIFCKFSTPKIKNNRQIVSVFPRRRDRAANRNVPEFIWEKTVDVLKQRFTVVLSGVPKGSCLVDYENENVVNLINYEGDDKLDKTILYLNNSVCSISSQSGLTHLSLATDCPSYIIGHEKERHIVKENRLNTPTSFRYVADYRAIDAETIISDVSGFLNELYKAGYNKNFDEVVENDVKILEDIIHG